MKRSETNEKVLRAHSLTHNEPLSEIEIFTRHIGVGESGDACRTIHRSACKAPTT